MRHHAEFLNEDFMRYVAECRHMASLARPTQGGLREAKAPLRWADFAAKVRSLNA